jgi:hypothetical protein
MTIYIDDEMADLPGDDLAALLDAAQSLLEPTGRVVVEVQLDGRPLTGEELEQRQGEPITDADLRLYSADPKALAAQTLEQVRERLQHALVLQEQAADLFQHDEPGQALGKIAEAVEVWMQAQQVVSYSAALIQLDLAEMIVDDTPLTTFTDQLIDKLRSLKELITHNDSVGLADALSYEWPQVVQQWDRLLGEMAQAMASAK